MPSMPQSKRKSLPLNKEGEAPTPTPSNETPRNTRRSSRIASKRKSDVTDVVSDDHRQPSTPSPKKQKKLPSRTKKSPQKVTIEVRIQSASSQQKNKTENEVSAPEARQETHEDGAKIDIGARSAGANSAITTPKNRHTRVIAETPGMYDIVVVEDRVAVEEAPVEETIATSHSPIRPAEEKEAVVDEPTTFPKSSPKAEPSPEKEAPLGTPRVPASAPKSRSSKIVFDDEYDFAAAAESAKANAAPPNMQPTNAEDEVEGDEDDEAPEDVDVGPNQSKADLAKKAAAKAAEEQAALRKKKRQERDVLFKKQAEERKTAAAPKADDDTVPKGQDLEAEVPTETSSGAPTASLAATSKSRRRQRYTRATIPDILPAEFLTDSESGSEDEDEAEALPPAKRAKKITFGEMEEAMDLEARKQSMDERVGDTVLRVSKTLRAEDMKLPPRPAEGSNGKRRKAGLQVQRRKGIVAPIKGKRKGFFFKK